MPPLYGEYNGNKKKDKELQKETVDSLKLKYFEKLFLQQKKMV